MHHPRSPKISEAQNECTDMFYDPQPLSDTMISLCTCLCVLYQSTLFQVVPNTVPVFPNVIRTMWETNQGAEPYVEHWISD